MSQHAPSSSTGFFSKIRENYSSKFASLSLSTFIEKDGNAEDETLIHNAFVKYYDSQGQPYPDWLGVSPSSVPPPRSAHRQSYHSNHSGGSGDYSGSLHPVQQTNSYNNSYSQRMKENSSPARFSPTPQSGRASPSPEPSQERPSPSYRPSASRLQDMYNKSRQQSIPGSGYNSSLAPQPGRSNSYSNSGSGSRLRERMLNSSTTLQSNHDSVNTTNSAPPHTNSKATWGRR
ncbi:Sec1-binding region of Mso1-domain-containing protein [Scheffersomyces xylosifermentans]|uniref:Sec1-binding region of Mso1-domain-containing protein n=1 Tax=Scheffersomyces xylosifermentans TaxID=1304137 RepID=UPI00315C890B